ncbi:HPr family phosphocarrier protein [Alicyclobacillus fastidiosus]|uniref:Phosphocarrier protein HPr n=1 Tax=Alicyclobacillus fastidiosus TaxID=392011 RepID=A0ABV5AGH2_9BACL|nr:HPr family phosphocarrier protein [Alicyclobacillus fastidiosus]WEH08983.1 HPr family phosphocarrier protein [Alicyclobacillus fastidiosus]
MVVERQVTLKNVSGLHARPASQFVAEATKFTSSVSVEVNGKRVDAKSILGLLSLGISQGQAISIITEGPDEEQALTTLCKLVDDGFGE